MRTRIPIVGHLLLSAICLASIASAQTSWWRTYGGPYTEEGDCVLQTTDGGYVIVGWTTSFGGGNGDVYLIKTDASGDTLWTRTYGGPDKDQGYSIQRTSDSGYIIAGCTYSFGAANGDVYLIKTGASGDTLWTRAYGGMDEEWGISVQQTADGGYIIGGTTLSFGAGDRDFYLIRTDASGDTLWTRTYGGTGYDECFYVQQVTDGGYAIAGYTISAGDGTGYAYLIRTDPQGDTLWTRTYGGEHGAVGTSLEQTSDGGYVIAGATEPVGSAFDDVYLAKINVSGDTLWTRTYGGTRDDWGWSVQQTSDGGYIIAGLTRSYGQGIPLENAYLIKTNASGDTLWTRAHGGENLDRFYSVQQTADGGCIAVGFTGSFGAGYTDLYLIKTDSLGNVGVADESPGPHTQSRELAATILSAAAGVKRPASSVVFDAMGRRVLHPRSGIYFLKTAATSAPRKVLLVK